MKNHWLMRYEQKIEEQKKPEKKVGGILKGFPPSNTVSPTIRITDKDLTFTYHTSSTPSSWWGTSFTYNWMTPVVCELPQHSKTAVMQVKVCPKTGIKHNFTDRVQEGNLEEFPPWNCETYNGVDLSDYASQFDGTSTPSWYVSSNYEDDK